MSSKRGSTVFEMNATQSSKMTYVATSVVPILVSVSV